MTKRGCKRQNHLRDRTKMVDLLDAPRKPSAHLVRIEAQRDRDFADYMRRQCARQLVWVQLQLFEVAA